ncbi:NUDIX hydrolase [Catenuloplanes atrovinosus]|uniref:8-oxo-dGTP pyrophosphatase MutT (NUDIX family) n=1 Tax=Catenuloplanes atrovinosus TaxID=137266 RepID=A0AAE3YLZ6_9ACTN|nr:NUDIX domain-containing protein [Catenuloplanes atrovinosus]MDR7275975.1 8-oxo-dGTP pyrophosphatase MutT (NUDIX family) [Catenuloplanes atrovinosus]
MRVIDKVAWLHIENRRLLTARSHGRELFYVPGGKREPGESDVDTLVREIAEELTVVIDPATAVPAGVFDAPADGKSDVLVRMTCYTADCAGAPTPSAEIAELAWLGYHDRDRTSAATRRIIGHLRDSGLLS